MILWMNEWNQIYNETITIDFSRKKYDATSKFDLFAVKSQMPNEFMVLTTIHILLHKCWFHIENPSKSIHQTISKLNFVSLNSRNHFILIFCHRMDSNYFSIGRFFDCFARKKTDVSLKLLISQYYFISEHFSLKNFKKMLSLNS